MAWQIKVKLIYLNIYNNWKLKDTAVLLAWHRKLHRLSAQVGGQVLVGQGAARQTPEGSASGRWVVQSPDDRGYGCHALIGYLRGSTKLVVLG